MPTPDEDADDLLPRSEPTNPVADAVEGLLSAVERLNGLVDRRPNIGRGDAEQHMIARLEAMHDEVADMVEAID